MSQPEKELLHWHHRLGHVGMRRVMWLMRQGALATSALTRSLHARACKFGHVPLCTACQFAKQRRESAPGTVKRNKPDQEAMLKTDALLPGARIFSDHIECRPKGRRLHACLFFALHPHHPPHPLFSPMSLRIRVGAGDVMSCGTGYGVRIIWY